MLEVLSFVTFQKTQEFRHKMGNQKKEKVGKRGNGSVGFYQRNINASWPCQSTASASFISEAPLFFFLSFSFSMASLKTETHTYKHTFQSRRLKLHLKLQVSGSTGRCFPSREMQPKREIVCLPFYSAVFIVPFEIIIKGHF